VSSLLSMDRKNWRVQFHYVRFQQLLTEEVLLLPMRRKTPRICNYLEYLKNQFDHFMDRDPYKGKCKVKDQNGKWVKPSI
jgi:hypothetical protein